MNYLREYRLRAGMNQKQLAKLLNVSQACVSRWERKIVYPEIETAKKISDILHMPFHLIFDYISHFGAFAIPVYEAITKHGQGRLLTGQTPHITLSEEDMCKLLPQDDAAHAHTRKSENFIGFYCNSTSLAPQVMPHSVNIVYKTDSIYPNRIHLASINNQDCTLVRLSTDNKNHVILSDNVETTPRCFHPTEIKKGVLRIYGLVLETRHGLGY